MPGVGECRDRHPDCSCRWRHALDPCGFGCESLLPNHAPLIVAEQFGTLETLLSGAHPTPRTGARSGNRQAHLRCVATGFGNQRRSICGGCSRTATFLRSCGSGAGCPGDSRSGAESPTFYPGIERVRGISGSHARLPFAFASQFRARCSEGRARSLPRSLQAFPPNWNCRT